MVCVWSMILFYRPYRSIIDWSITLLIYLYPLFWT